MDKNVCQTVAQDGLCPICVQEPARPFNVTDQRTGHVYNRCCHPCHDGTLAWGTIAYKFVARFRRQQDVYPSKIGSNR